MGQLMQLTPNRVLTNQGMTTYEDAVARGVRVAVVFVRDDGWTLGAPCHLWEKAFKLWDGSWESFVNQEGVAKDISQFRGVPRPRTGVFGLY